jgi:Fic family protein
MSWEPHFTITPLLLSRVEAISALRVRILDAAVELPWIPALQKDARTRNAHSSTAIEGNPLTLEQVRAVESGQILPEKDDRSRREILNYFAALRFIEKNAKVKKIDHEHLFRLHKIMAGDVMDQGEAGRYRTMRVRVGKYLPPHPEDVSGLMWELLQWWNERAPALSPVLTSAVLHHRFEAIHPFADGNGRTGRALALWELFRRGFDSHHLFSVDEFYWEDRPRYYASLGAADKDGGDLTAWLEYSAEGLQATLERVWLRMQNLAASAKRKQKLVLRPRQEQLLMLLRERGPMAPAQLWKALKISKQGAIDLLNPLLKAGIVVREGTKRHGQYRLL